MKVKYFEWTVVIALLLGIFYAFYFRSVPEIKQEPVNQKPSIEVPLEKIEPPKDESKDESSDEDLQEDPFAKVKVKEPIHIPANFTIPVSSNEAFQVAIIGESLGFDLTRGYYDPDILLQFSKMLSEHLVKALFLTGNFESDEKNKAKITTEEALKTVDGTEDLQIRDQLSILYSSNKDILPLFPTLKNNETSLNQAKLIASQFKETDSSSFDARIGYTVSIGEAFFAVISDGNSAQNNLQKDDSFSKKVQTWLNDVLASAKRDHRFLFVVGHEPAFFSSTIFSDKSTANHDQFWKILVGNGVRAYFSSREHFYDRSYRFGVWQLVSSGGEAILTPDGVNAPFFHCLMLTIPTGKDAVPKVQVLDIEGNVIDSFELKRKAEPLYQMRISSTIDLKGYYAKK